MRYRALDLAYGDESEVDADSPVEAAEKFARWADRWNYDEMSVVVTDLATGERSDYLVAINRTATYHATPRGKP